jgi:hypothetical protein
MGVLKRLGQIASIPFLGIWAGVAMEVAVFTGIGVFVGSSV